MRHSFLEWIKHCYRLLASKNFSDIRPWGQYKTIDLGPNYAVKTIVVKPHQRLSLQRHKHRTENWVVVGGKGLAEVNGEAIELVPGQHIKIPVSGIHRIANVGDIALTFVEVQLGNPLAESDIERLEDDYGRNEHYTNVATPLS